ncbi:MAG TPA: DUF5722 domain-containing protein [Methylomirabilota bacterium]|nr:DUF5722 domain-containing protein [Methylomirabilota bacterium]
MRTFHLLAIEFFLCALLTAAGASRYDEPYPNAASKKGLQVEIVDDALALGIKHAALNFNLAQLVDPKGDTNNPGWEFNGRTYHFHRSAAESMDRRIKTLSDRGVVVSLIVLTYQSRDAEVNRILIHPGCVTNAPNRLGNFNTVTDEGRRWLTATLEFCAERWSRSDQKFGRVAGYIMGNEVNSHWWWANMGRVTMEGFADDYLRTVRLAQTAIRRQSSWARVYISLEHHWNIRYAAGDARQSFPGRTFVDYFAKRAKEMGDFDWHMAFHPYPENLFEPRFWNDKSATTNVLTTPRITFKNIELLPAYLRRPELLYNGQPRQITLSEQGFHTPKGTNGEIIQAAAYCYAYKKIEKLDGIDSFILHRHVDHKDEGGLLLGLRSLTPNATESRPKKRIWEVFRAADTPEWEQAFRFALPIIGLSDWSSTE